MRTFLWLLRFNFKCTSTDECTGNAKTCEPQVNLGNAGSHMVEVFAGSSTSTEPFKRLIPVTTLMTKNDAKPVTPVDFPDDLSLTSNKINQCVKLFSREHMIDSVS